MLPFNKDSSHTVLIYAESGGSPVTGLVAADFTLNVAKNSTRSAVSLTGLVTEVDATNMPGYYAVTLASGVFDTLGALALQFTNTTPSTFDGFSIMGRVWDTENDVVSIESKVDTIDTVVDTINSNLTTVDGIVDSIFDYVKDIRAMSKINYVVDNTTYDALGNLTAARVRGWNPGANVSVDPAILTITIGATYDASGNLTGYTSTE